MRAPGHRPLAFALCLGLCAVAAGTRAADLPAQARTAQGSEAGLLQGAPWRMDMPARWNGELVMLAHGFEPVGTPRASEWPANEATAALLHAGFAVAQSGYASQGWAVSDAVADTERLRARVLAAQPRTRRTWILGFSMGGAVAIATLERHAQHYAGGVSLCGANLPGAVLASEMLTSLLAFDYFFPAAPGLPREGLASPAAAALRQAALYQAIAEAVQAQPGAATQLAARLQVSTEQLPGTISLHALVLHDLVKRSGGMPVGNRTTVYAGFGDDTAFNAGVRRLDADPGAEAALARQLGLSGALTRPLVIQYNRDDPTIAPRWEGLYTALATRAGATPAPTLLAPVGEGHCGFSDEAVLRALQQVRQAR